MKWKRGVKNHQKKLVSWHPAHEEWSKVADEVEHKLCCDALEQEEHAQLDHHDDDDEDDVTSSKAAQLKEESVGKHSILEILCNTEKTDRDTDGNIADPSLDLFDSSINDTQ